MSRGPGARSVMIGDAAVAALRGAPEPLTTRELAAALGCWDMPVTVGCPQDPLRRAESHHPRRSEWTFVSCLAKPFRDGRTSYDVPCYDMPGKFRRFDHVVHTWNRPLFASDLQAVLARLVRDGLVLKTRLDRFNATVYAAAPSPVAVAELEAMWSA